MRPLDIALQDFLHSSPHQTERYISPPIHANTVRFALQLGTHLRGKKKREEMGNLLRKMSRKAAPNA